MLTRRTTLKELATGPSALRLPAVAHAQQFPSKPITLICPWPAGAPTDVVIRTMSEVASKHLGQPVIIDNKAGATGTLGPAAMAATAIPAAAEENGRLARSVRSLTRPSNQIIEPLPVAEISLVSRVSQISHELPP